MSKPKPHVPPIDSAWLAQLEEPPLPVAYPVIDSHFHLWDYSDPPYFGDSYRRDAESAGISAAVYAECSMAYREDGPEAEKVLGEVAFALAEARAHSTPGCRLGAAIIGAADVRLGAGIAPILEQAISLGEGRFRGIRVRAATDPDPAVGYGPDGPPPEFLLQPACLEACRVLQRLGLTLEVYLFHHQLADVARLAEALPDLPIVLNHLGAPLGGGRYAGHRAEVEALWRAGITRLAPHRNVVVKIGGFAISRINLVARGARTLPASSSELAEAYEPWLDHCLASFGADRCLYGSNFPVDKIAMSLPVQVNAMKRLAARLSDSEAAALMGGTARRVYRLS